MCTQTDLYRGAPEGPNYSVSPLQQQPNHEDMIHVGVTHHQAAQISHTSPLHPSRFLCTRTHRESAADFHWFWLADPDNTALNQGVGKITLQV